MIFVFVTSSAPFFERNNEPIQQVQSELVSNQSVASSQQSLTSSKTNSPTHCQYNRAYGFWEDTAPRDSAWDPKGQWVWSTFRPECPVTDVVTELLESGLHSKEPKWVADHRKARGGAPLFLLIIGDSTDQRTVGFFCKLALKYGFTEIHGYDKADGCTNGVVRIQYSSIFGLVMPCQVALIVYTRRKKPWDTLPRLGNLSRFVNDTETLSALSIGSCLWDLSRECTTGRRVNSSFAMAYAAQVRTITTLLYRDFPQVQMYWRMCAPVSAPYDKNSITRVRQSQVLLNSAVRDGTRRARKELQEASPYFGPQISDWWTMIMTRYDDIDGLARDGRHYGSQPCLAHLNNLLLSIKEKLQVDH